MTRVIYQTLLLMRPLFATLGFILLLFFPTKVCTAQTDDPMQIRPLVKQLSWNNISINCQYFLVLAHSDSLERELVAIGKPATPFLIEAMSDPSKAVIAHIILTGIWEPEKNYDFATMYIYQRCNDLLGWHHIFNGFSWTWTEAGGETIEADEITLMKEYWTAKWRNSETLKLRSQEEIASQLKLADKKIYPQCDKIYDNNSASLKATDLALLLGKKVTDPQFTDLCTMLGNDSTYSRFSDRYYVTYSPEGLSFLFIDDILTTIFFESNFKGTLPAKLDWTFRKSYINLKLLQASSCDKFGCSYKEQNMHINYTEDGDMETIILSAVEK